MYAADQASRFFLTPSQTLLMDTFAATTAACLSSAPHTQGMQSDLNGQRGDESAGVQSQSTASSLSSNSSSSGITPVVWRSHFHEFMKHIHGRLHALVCACVVCVCFCLCSNVKSKFKAQFATIHRSQSAIKTHTQANTPCTGSPKAQGPVTRLERSSSVQVGTRFFLFRIGVTSAKRVVCCLLASTVIYLSTLLLIILQMHRTLPSALSVDPLREVAAEIARHTSVLAIDEMHVTDQPDAMLLKRCVLVCV